MIKRRSLIAIVAFVLVFLFTLISNISIFGRTPTVYADDVTSYVTVNAQKLYSGYYLESNDATSYSTGATTEPVQYVAWYKDGILILNNYNGGQITTGVDLIIKLKGTNTIKNSIAGISANDCENIVIDADDADSEATLNINVESNEDWIFGISVGYGQTATTGSLTIKGKATVNINSKTSNGNAYGIYARIGFNIVDSANLNIKNTSSKPTSDMSYSILSGVNKPLFNTDGIVTLDNSECANRNYCIAANNGIDMKKGTLICKYKPGDRYSYAVFKRVTTAPDGCVLREDPFYLGETIIKSGEIHTVTIENGEDTYQKSSNQYVVGETVRVNTSIDDLQFKGWEGEDVSFEKATQKETTFTMIDKDVTVRAVYDIFIKQPTFERINDDKGLISMQLYKQTSGFNPIRLIKSNGEEDVNVSFSYDPASANYTYNCSMVWASYTPKGKYRICVEYNGKYFYSEPFEIDYADKNPNAKVSDAIVNGKRGIEITPVSFDVTLYNATFKLITEGMDVSNWFGFLPGGLTAKIDVVSDGATSATITISGTSKVKASSAIYLNIPKEVLATGNDNVITTKHNDNTKFNIVDPTSYIASIISGKAQVGGTTKTSIEEGSTVTITADVIEGYVFEKWVVVTGMVILADENNATTKFVMPESNVEIKATYKELPHIHSYKNVPEKKATCIATGVKEHFECDGCGKLFDVDKKETTEDLLKISINPDAHDLATEWTVTKEGHYHICKNGCVVGHDELKGHIPDRTAATETEPVKCTECGYIISPIIGHVHHLSEVIGRDATCTEDGKKTYYVCVGCELKFKDETGNEEITDESWIVIPKAHKFGAWIEEVPATTEATGKKAHKTCAFCHNHFDQNGDVIENLTIAKLPKLTYVVTIENGTTSAKEYEVGQTVTIIANDSPDGKEFDKWVVISGDVTIADVNSTTTTFVMPDDAVEIKATYKNKTPNTDDPNGEIVPNEKGLNTGAIVGIVIGSIVVIGLGGFAIFWFGIKKKTFAELISTKKDK